MQKAGGLERVGGELTTVGEPTGRATAFNPDATNDTINEDTINEDEHAEEEPFNGWPDKEGSRRSERSKKRRNRLIEEEDFGKLVESAASYLREPDNLKEPESFKEAINSPQSNEWKKAMDDEFKSLKENKTWKLMKLPKGRRAVKSKWTYKLKRGSDGKLRRFKARLVAKGYSQRKGVDFKETYAPVVRYESVRTLLSIAAAKDLEIIQLDVKTAFLHGDLEEEIYLEQPEGYQKPGQEELVCKLNKSIYGLRQASRTWNSKFDGILKSIGFKRSDADHCVYTRKEGDDIIYLAIWVDDGLLCGNNMEKLNEIVAHLQGHIDVSISDAEFFVGMKITRDRPNRILQLTQEYSINKMLNRFKMEDCTPKTVLADPYVTLTLDGVDGGEVSKGCNTTDYQEAVGSMMYLMTCTRPDIAYAVGQLAQFCHNPKEVHWTAVQRLLAYLKGTSRLGIQFSPSNDENTKLIAYTDSDWAGDADARRSTTGIIFIHNGGPIIWASRKQKCVSLSTTEAEYVAMCEGGKDVTWLRQLLGDLGEDQRNPTTLRCDNQGAVKLVHNPEYRRRTKHIDVKYHFIRELQQRGTIQVDHVGTKEQLADLLTKALGGPTFQELRRKIGMSSVAV